LTPRKATATSASAYLDGLGWFTAGRNCNQTAHGPLPLADPIVPIRRRRKGLGPAEGEAEKGLAQDRIRSRLAESFHVAQRRTGFPVGGRHAQHGAAGVGAQQSSRKFEALERKTSIVPP
jgi:hypothetical protein